MDGLLWDATDVFSFSMRLSIWFIVGCNEHVFKTFAMRCGEWFIVRCIERFLRRLLYYNGSQ
jgi:hypothetical protein